MAQTADFGSLVWALLSRNESPGDADADADPHVSRGPGWAAPELLHIKFTRKEQTVRFACF